MELKRYCGVVATPPQDSNKANITHNFTAISTHWVLYFYELCSLTTLPTLPSGLMTQGGFGNTLIQLSLSLTKLLQYGF